MRVHLTANGKTVTVADITPEDEVHVCAHTDGTICVYTNPLGIEDGGPDDDGGEPKTWPIGPRFAHNG